MFGELPKLFDRNFFIGYFLPFAIFIAVNTRFALVFSLYTSVLSTFQNNTLFDITLISLITWIGGIGLLATNREILRLMQGYGVFNPARLFAWIENHRFEELHRQISELNIEYNQYRANGEEFPSELQAKRIQLSLEAAERFPDQQIWLLPTAFGNIIRAFEVYPRVMYGFEAIQGWSRLHSVLPKEYLQFVDNEKAQMDFWVNIWFLSFSLLLEDIGLAIYSRQTISFWFWGGVLVVMAVSSSMARRSASEWGDWVKSAFDIFLLDLQKKLGHSSTFNQENKRNYWVQFSQAIIYRLPSSMPKKTQLEQKEDEQL